MILLEMAHCGSVDCPAAETASYFDVTTMGGEVGEASPPPPRITSITSPQLQMPFKVI